MSMTGSDIEVLTLKAGYGLGGTVNIYNANGAVILGPQQLFSIGGTYVEIGVGAYGTNVSRIALEGVSRVTITNTPEIQIWMA